MASVPEKLPGNQGTIKALSRLGVVAAICAVVISVATIFFLADSVRDEIDGLASANSDTTQWSLAQVEVDLLYLRLAAEQASAEDRSSLIDLRRRFDVFYSRVGTLTNSRQLQALRDSPQAETPLTTVVAFLDRFVPAIDADDTALIAALPSLREDLTALRQPVRELSLLGVRLFASASDERRENVAELLSRIALLTLALVITLVVVVLIFFGLFRRSLLAERAAADAGSRLQEVISTSIDGILAVDRNGRVIDYNGAAERIFGYSRAEAIGQDMASLIIPDHLRPKHDEGMARFRETGERHVVGSGLLRLEANRKDGTIFPVEVTISSAMSGGEEIFVAFLRDISKRVADETELIEARDKAVAGEKAKAELLAVMSHEMRTPLNGLIGTMELMEDTPLEARQKTYLGAMETSAKLLLHHVNGVLNISKADAGQLDLKPLEIDPARLLSETVESQRRSIEAHGNRISLHCENAPDHIWGDPLRLRQVVLNLVGNADKFTRNGDIVVECDLVGDGSSFEIRVADTGIGIAESDHERIFEDFRTLDASYGRTTEGTGLGLGIARRLVIAMGGTIGVESEPGEGSLFWVRLPVGEPSGSQCATPSSPTSKPSEPTTKAMTVLLVEDNEINRLVARDMLAKAGHSVHEAHDGREGVCLAGMQGYDVILMDISMPHMDGIEATSAIRRGDGPNAATPIVALTAHALPEDIERFRQAGINETLTKPLTKTALADMLAGLNGEDSERPHNSDANVAQGLNDLRDQLGTDQLHGLVVAFLQEADATVATVTSMMENEAAGEDTAGQVHKLAGSASVFGLVHLADHLRDLETALRAGETGAAKKKSAELDVLWPACRGQLEAFVRARS